jgi:iron complex transport system substrate-binding protein
MFASVDAVKNKRVYKFPQFDRSPDAAEIFLNDDWLARIAHPELFKDAKPFSAAMTDSYKLIYQKDLTADQIKKVLELEQNKDSAGYNDILG